MKKNWARKFRVRLPLTFIKNYRRPFYYLRLSLNYFSHSQICLLQPPVGGCEPGCAGAEEGGWPASAHEAVGGLLTTASAQASGHHEGHRFVRVLLLNQCSLFLFLSRPALSLTAELYPVMFRLHVPTVFLEFIFAFPAMPFPAPCYLILSRFTRSSPLHS